MFVNSTWKKKRKKELYKITIKWVGYGGRDARGQRKTECW